MLIEELKEKLTKFTEKMDKNWTPAQFKYYKEIFEETFEDSKRKTDAMKEVIHDMTRDFNKITRMMAKMELYPHQLKQDEYNKKMLGLNKELESNDRRTLVLTGRIEDLNITMTSLRNTSKYMPLDGPKLDNSRTVLGKMEKDKLQLMNDKDIIEKKSGDILMMINNLIAPMVNNDRFKTEHDTYKETEYLDYRYQL